jgi:hypothetical protein
MVFYIYSVMNSWESPNHHTLIIRDRVAEGRSYIEYSFGGYGQVNLGQNKSCGDLC